MFQVIFWLNFDRENQSFLRSLCYRGKQILEKTLSMSNEQFLSAWQVERDEGDDKNLGESIHWGGCMSKNASMHFLEI